MKSHRVSKIKRKHVHGFRTRMKTVSGRRIINNKRRMGRPINVRDK